MIKKTLTLIIISTVLMSCISNHVKVVTSTEKNPWFTTSVVVDDKSESVDLEIDRTQKRQTMEGWGACFNELGWVALGKLSEESRASILEEFFAPDKGANFNICRMPIAANDFSRDWYSYNETEGDFAMENFSISNDLETLVPYMKKALIINPDIKIWGSPWSPPSWMKYNKHYACATSPESLAKQYRNDLPTERNGAEGTNMFIQEDKYFKAYALYFSKYIEAYKAQGIDISMVMPQNEFNSCQNFPSCTWTAQGLATFIGEYLGPAMQEKGVEIMFGTMERPSEELIDTIFNDPKARKYVTGVGFQWAGKEALPGINKRYPDIKLYQTEQECGDGKNDWQYCVYAWSLMKHYLSNGASAYMYWNMALENGGVSRWGWSQNSLVTVHGDGSFNYNHEYYLMKHFSHFVKPGATLLQTEGPFKDALVFENPDGSVVIVARNERKKKRVLSFRIDETQYAAELEPDSFNTIEIQ